KERCDAVHVATLVVRVTEAEDWRDTIGRANPWPPRSPGLLSRRAPGATLPGGSSRTRRFEREAGTLATNSRCIEASRMPAESGDGRWRGVARLPVIAAARITNGRPGLLGPSSPEQIATAEIIDRQQDALRIVPPDYGGGVDGGPRHRGDE